MATIRKNKNDILGMMGLCEEITRTNNRVYELLRTILTNPGNKHNLSESIKDLTDKVNMLKKVPYDEDLVNITEDVVVPTIEDISPRSESEYDNSNKENNPITPEEETTTDTPQPPQNKATKPERKRNTTPKPPMRKRKRPNVTAEKKVSQENQFRKQPRSLEDTPIEELSDLRKKHLEQMGLADKIREKQANQIEETKNNRNDNK